MAIDSRDAANQEDPIISDQEPESPVRRNSGDERSLRRPSNPRTVDTLEGLSDGQLLRKIVRAIEWNLEILVDLLRQKVDSRDEETNAALYRPTQLGLDPNASRMLPPGPGLIDHTPEEELEQASLTACARYHFRRTEPEQETEERERESHAHCPVFIIIGLFDGPDMAPKELCIVIKHDRWVFWYLWLGAVRLRGLRYIFSLKDCTAFRLYEV
jgi:hypothetical protein